MPHGLFRIIPPLRVATTLRCGVGGCGVGGCGVGGCGVGGCVVGGCGVRLRGGRCSVTVVGRRRGHLGDGILHTPKER